MGTLISITERLSSKAEAEGRTRRAGALGPGTMVLLFTIVAVAMTAGAVLVGANSWGDAVTLVILISVVALLKLALANFMFFAMLKADEQVDRRIVLEPEPQPPTQRRASTIIVGKPPGVREKSPHRPRSRFAVVGGKALANHPFDSATDEK